jgi:hypothetical protein
LNFGNDATAKNPRIIFMSHSQPHLCWSRANSNYQISSEYSISLKESVDVKTNGYYSGTKKVAGNVEPVTTISCLLNTRRRLMSTNSRSNRNGKKLAWGKTFIATSSAVGQFNSVLCSGVVPVDVLSIVYKSLIRKNNETVTSARAFSCKETSS